MPIPTSIADLSKVASENSPAGTESVKGTIDDYLRAGFAFLRQLSDMVNGPTVALPSAATVQIGFAGSLNISITGTTTITAFDTIAEGAMRWVTFAGALTLTHNATSLQLPGAANIVTTAGDAALFKSLGGGNWKCLGYQRMSGAALIPALPLAGGTMTGSLTFNNNVQLQWKDTGGTARWVMSMDGSNNINIVNTGGAAVQILNQFGTVVQTWNNSGVSTSIGSQVVKTTAANATQRTLCTFQQSNGANRYILGINTDERPVLWTYNTSGVLDGAVHFGNGNVTADGTVSGATVTQTSDERKKKKWQRLPGDFIEKLSRVRKAGVFQWKKGGKACVGIGAQSLEAILPEAVYTDDEGGKTVNAGGAALAILPEVARELVRLRARLDALEAE